MRNMGWVGVCVGECGGVAGGGGGGVGVRCVGFVCVLG